MEITRIRTRWPEEKGFFLNRDDTGEEHVFIQYLSPVRVLTVNGMIDATAGSCILHSCHAHQYFTSADTPLLHDWLHVRGDLDEAVLRYGLQYDTLYTVRNSEAVSRLLRQMEEGFLTRPVYFRELLALKMEELLLTVARESKGEGRLCRIPADTMNRFLSLRTRMNDERNYPWSIPEMASLLGFSPSRFCRLYQEIFQITPKRDLQNIRIEHAKMLLVQQRYPVREVAELCGYTNPYHFIRAFRQHTGTTPKAYSLNH